MDEIKEAATTIAKGESFDWEYYLIFLGLIIVGTYISSFISEYSKKRGSQFATKADIKQIHEQLKSTTSITESIKSDIAHGAWRSRELELLKREKIEQYLTNVYESKQALHKKMSRDFFIKKLLGTS